MVYQQSFDNPAGANGDVYFTTDANYNGITDGSSSGGISTGGSFVGGTTLHQDGQILTGFGPLAPVNGGYLLAEQTNETFPDNTSAGTFFSTAGTPITLLPQSTYRLSFYLGMADSINPPTITTLINGAAQGPAVTPTTTGVMQNVTYTFNSGGSTSATIALVDGTVEGYGNDYAVDAIQFTVVQAAFPTAGLDPNQTAIARNLSSGPINGVSGPVYNAVVSNPASYPGVLNQLSPEEFGRFSSITAFDNASFEIEAMDNYFANRRGADGSFVPGNSGVDASGLTVNDPSYDPNLAMVHSRLLAWNPPPDRGIISDVAGPVLGGVDTKDAASPSSLGPQMGSHPWNVYVRGSVVLAHGFSEQDVPSFHDHTSSVVLGADYRLTPHWLVGLKAGYGHTDATLDDNGSSATVDSYFSGLDASYADQGWYANFVGDYIHDVYTQDREIGFLAQSAHSSPDGNEGVADLDGGYDFHHGALTLGPLAGLQYAHLSVDGYNESGSVADLSVNGQQDDSLRSRLGGRASYALTAGDVVFRPRVDAAWEHEFMDQARGITSQFEGTGLGSFVVRTPSPQRDFALATVGLDVDITPSLMAFAEYMVQAGQANFFGQAVQAGVGLRF